MTFIKYILYIIFILFSYIGTVNANINLTVSPIKYEIDTYTGSTVSKTATLFNRSNQSYTIITGKSDFESKDSSGNPSFVRKSELVFPGQSLSEWINIDTDTFLINPGETKEINFTITVPENATPGGYYGAIFFKNNSSLTADTGAYVNINIDYGVLLLVKINGKIITIGNTKETIITNNSSSFGWGGGASKFEIDDCTIDLTSSKFDGICIDNLFNDENIKKNIKELGLGEETEIKTNDFDIIFETLFENEGNIHLKPNGKIKLVDESGNIIKGIGKEIIKNDNGAVIGHKIVDYIPINDNGGNVLPGTNRNFESKWKGFPYKSYDSNGDPIINYWTPEEYYTKKNIEQRSFLYPWERINERINHEKINAYIDLSYIDNDGKVVEFNSAKEFYIDYKDQYIGLNPYAFIFIGIIIFLLILFRRKIIIIFFNKKENRCINNKCNEIIKKDIKVCPYCKTKQ